MYYRDVRMEKHKMTLNDLEVLNRTGTTKLSGSEKILPYTYLDKTIYRRA